MSGFGAGDDFDKMNESYSAGWRTALNDLRLYLTHYPGRYAAPITAGGAVHGRTRDEVWTELSDALGVPGRSVVGDRIKASAGGLATLSGTVQFTEPGILTLLLDEPAPGLGMIGAGGAGDEAYAVVRAHLFGDGTPAIAARDEPAWQAWLGKQLRGSAGAR